EQKEYQYLKTREAYNLLEAIANIVAHQNFNIKAVYSTRNKANSMGVRFVLKGWGCAIGG
ncbi:MAG: hypothetical protein ACK5L5_12380, partial [Bacteroidales bacterium]